MTDSDDAWLEYRRLRGPLGPTASARCPHCREEIWVQVERHWSTEENDHLVAAWAAHKPGNCLVNLAR